MKKVKLLAKIREKTGTRESRRLRGKGFITGEVYGAKEKNYHIFFERREFEKIWREIHGETVIFEIEFNDKKYSTVIKEIQRDVLYGYPIHIDFQILHEKEEITVPVPVILKGEAKGVKSGGILEHFAHQLHIRTIPSKIPSHIEIDISDLDIGESIHVRDIKLEEGIKIEESPDETICTIVGKRVTEVTAQEIIAPEIKEEKGEEKKKKE
ncbi:MAG: 50S ribosomal protein L25 [Candidatus Hydrothermales bacterium]